MRLAVYRQNRRSGKNLSYLQQTQKKTGNSINITVIVRASSSQIRSQKHIVISSGTFHDVSV
jgi:hypothetical protein